MRLRRVLTLQELSSAACCSGSSWTESKIADSAGLGVLFSCIGFSFLNKGGLDFLGPH
jgi:hypothetical protein